MKSRLFFVVLAIFALLAFGGNAFTTRLFGFGVVKAKVERLTYFSGENGPHMDVQVETPGPAFGRHVTLRLSDTQFNDLLSSKRSTVTINLDERGNAIFND